MMSILRQVGHGKFNTYMVGKNRTTMWSSNVVLCGKVENK
jgi:hypothetical protein